MLRKQKNEIKKQNDRLKMGQIDLSLSKKPVYEGKEVTILKPKSKVNVLKPKKKRESEKKCVFNKISKRCRRGFPDNNNIVGYCEINKNNNRCKFKKGLNSKKILKEIKFGYSRLSNNSRRRSRRRKSRKRSRRRRRRSRKSSRRSRKRSRRRRSRKSSRRRRSRKRSRRIRSRKSSRRRRSRKSSRRSRKRSRRRRSRRSRKSSRRRSRRRRSRRRRSRRSRKRRSMSKARSLRFKKLKIKEISLSFSGSKDKKLGIVKVDQLVTPLTIYSLDSCPACQYIKKECSRLNIRCKIYPADKYRDHIKKITGGYKYVPVIIDGNKNFIGGSVEFNKIKNNIKKLT
jgi:glutaredoxin